MLAAAPLAAQPPARPVFDLTPPALTAEPTFRASRGVRLPVIDYAERDGSRVRSSGIAAGIDVAPGATIGIGLFSTKRPRSALAPDPQLDRTTRSGKKAAVGISVRF
jgi:hypothetical protein